MGYLRSHLEIGDEELPFIKIVFPVNRGSDGRGADWLRVAYRINPDSLGRTYSGAYYEIPLDAGKYGKDALMGVLRDDASGIRYDFHGAGLPVWNGKRNAMKLLERG